jgi:hypothetical protein
MFPTDSNSRLAAPTLRGAVWHVVDRAVAFATLDAYGLPAPRFAVDCPTAHEHREPLRAPRRPRRPAPAPRAQHCVTPLTASARHRASVAAPRIASGVR